MQENEYSSQVDISYWKLNRKSMYIDLLVVIVVVVVVTVWFCCCSCVIVETHLQMNKNNKITYEQQHSGYKLLKNAQEYM